MSRKIIDINTWELIEEITCLEGKYYTTKEAWVEYKAMCKELEEKEMKLLYKELERPGLKNQLMEVEKNKELYFNLNMKDTIKTFLEKEYVPFIQEISPGRYLISAGGNSRFQFVTGKAGAEAILDELREAAKKWVGEIKEKENYE